MRAFGQQAVLVYLVVIYIFAICFVGCGTKATFRPLVGSYRSSTIGFCDLAVTFAQTLDITSSGAHFCSRDVHSEENRCRGESGARHYEGWLTRWWRRVPYVLFLLTSKVLKTARGRTYLARASRLVGPLFHQFFNLRWNFQP